ncbi:MAG TPA: hypothetical protein VHU89_07745 [Acidobacteriaceae bacterium]|jgi:hypothetical protein|nr:hypothetical protein [Acidobacteriaceae bacterium]
MAIRLFRPLLAAVVCLATVAPALADAAPFDLTGPKLEVKITRAGKTLPIAEVPNLAAGDRLWVRADLPPGQSAHYLLVVAFLRGSTNPPPENWFFRQETWDRKEEGKPLTVTVPQEAQQVVVFLAPETGGDFKTLMGAVRGTPGSFVRASQDLNQAMLDRSRLDTYLSSVRSLSREDPTKLKDAAPMLARSLGMKIDDKCLDRMPELQAACLAQGQDAMILSDGHSASIVEALTAGPVSDLAAQLSFTPQANYGYYSPYVGSIMDMARILDSFHTAQYQYIPALATEDGDRMSLMLNTAPSFHNPKSVLVTALPAVEPAQPPPLHPVDSKQNYCAEKNSLVLAVDGAPLVFSTGYAHEMILRLKTKSGKMVDEKVEPDAQEGGLVLEAKDLSASDFPNVIDASLHGYWGFEKYDGPAFRLQNTHAQHWQLAAADREALIVGREDTIHLSADDASCVDTILVKDSAGKELKANWTATAPDQVAVKVPLKETHPGPLELEVKQYGTVTAQTIPLRAFAEAGHLQSFELHAGDVQGVLKGSRLDDVANLALKGVTFLPGKADPTMGSDELPMVAKDAKAAAKLKQGETDEAEVTLTDGRVFPVTVAVGAPRPGVELIGKSVQASVSSAGSNIQLADQDELPQDAKLRFSIRAQSPAAFSRGEKIEVATEDESFSTTLSLDNGEMTLENSKVAVATLDPAKAFGSSAFGPLKFRVVENGAEGDWQPLATLVRLPELHDLKCPADQAEGCRLSGANLFLVDSVASDPAFAHPVQVPDGFPGYILPVPRPDGGQLYLKLRDDPSVVNEVMLAAERLPPPPGQAERHAARAAYHAGEMPPAPGATGQAGSPNPGAEAAPGKTPPVSGAQPPATETNPPAMQTKPQTDANPQNNSAPQGSAETNPTAPASPNPGSSPMNGKAQGSGSNNTPSGTQPNGTAASPPSPSAPPQS